VSDEYHYLIGAEDVSRAANNMVCAAEAMARATNNMDSALLQHQRFMDEWLTRLESVLAEARQP